jgi:hypothetical protein
MVGSWEGICSLDSPGTEGEYPATLAVDGDVDGGLETWFEFVTAAGTDVDQEVADHAPRLSGPGGGAREGNAYEIVALLSFKAPGEEVDADLARAYRSVAHLEGDDFSPGSRLSPELQLDIEYMDDDQDPHGTCDLDPE